LVRVGHMPDGWHHTSMHHIIMHCSGVSVQHWRLGLYTACFQHCFEQKGIATRSTVPALVLLVSTDYGISPDIDGLCYYLVADLTHNLIMTSERSLTQIGSKCYDLLLRIRHWHNFDLASPMWIVRRTT